MPASFANPAVTDPTISTTNNRLTSTGYTYDNAGNTTADAQGRTFVYDAENKQTSVSGTSGTIGQYSYDGDGKRVKKYVPGTGETTIFVYDAAGKQIAEYSTIVADTSTAKVNYLTNDHLGSPRINTDANGAIISRHDYHPFGEEINGTGGRTTALNYGSDTVRKQFTGYERDGETALDFAQARMYAPGLGRFTAVDPSRKSIQITSPQTWNRYTYCHNNPLTLVDDNGKWPTETHNNIIRTAFNNMNTGAIERGSYKVDVPGTVLEKNAYQHAMTPGSKVNELGLERAKAWAKGEAINFINQNLSEAKEWKSKARAFPANFKDGAISTSLEKFGEAMHTVMDNVSPAHRGFQVFSNENAALPGAAIGAVIGGLPGAVVGGVIGIVRSDIQHSSNESRSPTDSEMNLMVDRMRTQYRQTYGQEAYERAVTEDERNATATRIGRRETDGRAL